MADRQSLTPAWFARARGRLEWVLARSRVPEDPGHARDVERWLLRLCPDAGWALRFAALAHDVDRALPDGERVERRDFADYDDFKTAHAANSARVAARLLREADAPSSVVHEVTRLVLAHERGGEDAALAALCDADALSFFTHNLPFYRLREGLDETLRRVRWGIGRLSARGRRALATFPFADSAIRRMLHDEQHHEARGIRFSYPAHRAR